jgi:hypothetical protein
MRGLITFEVLFNVLRHFAASQCIIFAPSTPNYGLQKMLISLCGVFLEKSDIPLIKKLPGSVYFPKDQLIEPHPEPEIPVPTAIFLLHQLKFYPPQLTSEFQVTSSCQLLD